MKGGKKKNMRYEILEEKIRSLQGESSKIAMQIVRDARYDKFEPGHSHWTRTIYHDTKWRHLDAILQEGLVAVSRDVHFALQVSASAGQPGDVPGVRDGSEIAVFVDAELLTQRNSFGKEGSSGSRRRAQWLRMAET